MAFSATEVEDGTGLSTALVYEQASSSAAWLSHAARAPSSFNAAGAGGQDKALLTATGVVEDWLRGRLDGVVRTKEQALLFPRVGCTSRTGRTFATSEIPPNLLEAIRLMAEEEVANGGIDVPDDLEDIAAESVAGHTIQYRKSSRAGSASARYPKAWNKARMLFDPARRIVNWAA